MTTCGRCKKETSETVDIWVQSFVHYDDYESKGHEMSKKEMHDAPEYIILCTKCWEDVIVHHWHVFVNYALDPDSEV